MVVKIGSVQTKKGIAQRWRCTEGGCGKTWRVRARETITDRFPLPRTSQSGVESNLGEKEIGQTLGLLALGLSFSEVADLSTQSRDTCARMFQWNFERFEDEGYRQWAVETLNQFVKSGQWEWRLRDLWRVGQLDSISRRWLTNALRLSGDDFQTPHDTLEIYLREEEEEGQWLQKCLGELRQYVLEVLDLPSEDLSEQTLRSKADQFQRHRGRDKGLRKWVDNDKSVIKKIIGNERVYRTPQGRFTIRVARKGNARPRQNRGTSSLPGAG